MDDPQTEALAHKVVELYRRSPFDQRVIVAIAGPPGSGKSTLAYPLTARINQLLRIPAPSESETKSGTGNPDTPVPVDTSAGAFDARTGLVPGVDNTAELELVCAGAGGTAAPESTGSEDVAICVGLDGWHYSRAELDCFPDPTEAHYRRGAAFTFNLESYSAFLTQIRQPLHPSPSPPPSKTNTTPSPPIPFPTFSHALKDPQPSPIGISPTHRIVLIEGLYTLLDAPGWAACAARADMRVWVECPRGLCRERVISRNWAAGIVSTREACEERVDKSDMVNGDYVRERQYRPTDIIHPKDDPEAFA